MTPSLAGRFRHREVRLDVVHFLCYLRALRVCDGRHGPLGLRMLQYGDGGSSGLGVT